MIMEMRWGLLLGLALVSCRTAPPEPQPLAVPTKTVPRTQEPVPVCTPAGPEICGDRCGIVDAGCDEVLACQCAAGASCNDGRCEARQTQPPPPREEPPPRDDRKTRKRAKPKGKCSCCHHHGGAYLSAEQSRRDQEAFRKCIADGGACEGNCPVAP